jgi:hypothetical protein
MYISLSAMTPCIVRISVFLFSGHLFPSLCVIFLFYSDCNSHCNLYIKHIAIQAMYLFIKPYKCYLLNKKPLWLLNQVWVKKIMNKSFYELILINLRILYIKEITMIKYIFYSYIINEQVFFKENLHLNI